MTRSANRSIPPPTGVPGPIWLWAVAIAAAIIAIYARALSGGFIWDDVTYVVGNKLLQSSDALIRIWSDRALPDFWPLSFSLFWSEYRLFGEEPTGYHVVCLVLHLTNALLMGRILQRLGCRYAFVAALIFAVHPVNVESVAWIFQAKTTLAAALALGSLLLYLEDTRLPSHRRFAGSLLLFLCAMAAKASVVTWPAAMMLCARLASGEGFLARRGRALRRIAPFFAIAALIGAMNLWWYTGHGPEAPSELIRDDPLLSRLAIAGMSLWFYVGKALCPLHLSFVYPRWQVTVPPVITLIPLCAALLAALAVTLLRNRPRWGEPLFCGLGFYAVNLLPVLGVYEIYYMRYSFVADHWQYLSLMGLIALVVEAASRALEGRAAAGGIAAVMVVGLLGVLSYHQAGIYLDEETIWRDTLTKNPSSWMVHNSLGLLLKKQGRFDDALEHYSEAARLYPQGQSYYNMGKIFDEKGMLREALPLYRKAAELNPYYNIIFTNMGIVEARLGMHDEALADLKRAIELAPTAENHYNLGFFLEGNGELQQALDHFTLAKNLDPGNLLFDSAHQRVAAALSGKTDPRRPSPPGN